MSSLERICHDRHLDRELLLLEVAAPNQIPARLDSGDDFVCLLAWDASDADDQTLESVAKRLLDSGCVYICCWGPGCARVHVAFDLVDVERAPNGPVVMSTDHATESLEEAIWFALFTAYPDEDLANDCRQVLAVSIGSREWAGTIRAAMADSKSFSERLDESQ